MKKALVFLLVFLLALAPVSQAGAYKRTLLSAVSATGASSAVDCTDMETKTVYIVASSVTSGATVAIQTSYDGTNYTTVHSESVTANGTTEIALVGLYEYYLRVNITARTDGTYTVYFLGKS